MVSTSTLLGAGRPYKKKMDSDWLYGLACTVEFDRYAEMEHLPGCRAAVGVSILYIQAICTQTDLVENVSKMLSMLPRAKSLCE